MESWYLNDYLFDFSSYYLLVNIGEILDNVISDYFECEKKKKKENENEEKMEEYQKGEEDNYSINKKRRKTEFVEKTYFEDSIYKTNQQLFFERHEKKLIDAIAKKLDYFQDDVFQTIPFTKIPTQLPLQEDNYTIYQYCHILYVLESIFSAISMHKFPKLGSYNFYYYEEADYSNFTKLMLSSIKEIVDFIFISPKISIKLSDTFEFNYFTHERWDFIIFVLYYKLHNLYIDTPSDNKFSICKGCGNFFWKKRKNQMYCQSPFCQKERAKNRKRKQRGKNRIVNSQSCDKT